MFLAPLNYDKYFNKVFSDEKISKSFLEDFQEYRDDEIIAEVTGLTLEEITLL